VAHPRRLRELAARPLCRRDLDLVGQQPAGFWRDGDGHLPGPYPAERRDGRRPGADARGDDLAGQCVGNGCVQVDKVGVGHAQGVSQRKAGAS
jgi:hypothetical protein